MLLYGFSDATANSMKPYCCKLLTSCRMCRSYFGTAIAVYLVAAEYDIRLLGKPAPGFDTAPQVRVFDGERAFKTIKQGGYLMSRSWKPIFCTALLLAVLGVLAPAVPTPTRTARS